MLRSCLLAWALLLVTTHAFADKTYPPQKVIYHINYSDPSRLAATFTNIRNHIQTVGEGNIDLSAVIHGKAIEYFISAKQDKTKQVTLDTLRLNGTRFIICGNTLDAYRITREQLYDVNAEDMVQAGLPEIVFLQQQGFVYVRP
ncbi:DsrE family protein [Marinobacterium sediminicola]|uniref:Intracellular sulfur oxidation protein, DsrE/DsrF family n=1 Tax=Marinobacterium sediminicola TaxID=518898 RepID=A0ABY1S073_9GAMM|nr:DsrE family protein [Marinobacterium sediminicola]ULG70016.1 DsrE family protein [Marinobacterium sediminicola]SMR74470.1 hypothetical protein SAMN04487964_106116 [Marinobacterium sediminicola]